MKFQISQYVYFFTFGGDSDGPLEIWKYGPSPKSYSNSKILKFEMRAQFSLPHRRDSSQRQPRTHTGVTSLTVMHPDCNLL